MVKPRRGAANEDIDFKLKFYCYAIRGIKLF